MQQSRKPMLNFEEKVGSQNVNQQDVNQKSQEVERIIEKVEANIQNAESQRHNQGSCSRCFVTSLSNG